MRTVKTPIIIDASPEEVWFTLMKFYEYDNWNPVYQYVKGEPKLGDTVQIEVYPRIDVISQYVNDDESLKLLQSITSKKSMQYFRIKKLVEYRHLAWESKILWGFVSHIKQSFDLTTTEDGKTLFVQEQTVGGLLLNAMPNKIFDSYFTAINLAINENLKHYVEEKAV